MPNQIKPSNLSEPRSKEEVIQKLAAYLDDLELLEAYYLERGYTPQEQQAACPKLPLGAQDLRTLLAEIVRLQAEVAHNLTKKR